MRGLFVTFEGTEGTGKSTQVSLLGDALRERGLPVTLTREPGGTALGGDLRRMVMGTSYGSLSPRAELFLYLADRAQHLAEVIEPALGEGRIVICDRYADATVAYQGFGRRLDRGLIDSLNEGATARRKPDLTILLDLADVREGLGRAEGRDRDSGAAGREDRFEREALEFHLRVREGYLALAAEEPDRFRVLPADLPAAELHDRIMALLGEFAPLRQRFDGEV